MPDPTPTFSEQARVMFISAIDSCERCATLVERSWNLIGNSLDLLSYRTHDAEWPKPATGILWTEEEEEGSRTSPAIMGHSKTSVAATQYRVVSLLKRLAAERGLVLDPGSVVWFDGSREVPAEGRPWKLSFSAHNDVRTPIFTTKQLDAFMVGDPFEKLTAALTHSIDSLRS